MRVPCPLCIGSRKKAYPHSREGPTTHNDSIRRTMTATYKLGLALSGGGIKGFAHLGVLKYLEEIGVRPEILAGTSA